MLEKASIGYCKPPGSNHRASGAGKKRMYSGYIAKMSLNTFPVTKKRGGGQLSYCRGLSSANCPEFAKFPTASNSFLVPTGPRPEGSFALPESSGRTRQASPGPKAPLPKPA